MNSFRNTSVALSIMLSLLFFFYSEVILHPNDYLFATEGDGLTNYYNFAYHIKNGDHFTEFEGMNYPFGESLIYIDSHPILAFSLKYLKEQGLDISPYSIGILNSLMLVSVLIAALFLCLLFTMHGFPWIISVLGSVAITLLSSQALLWHFGHYALSYVCFFPMSWYLYQKYLTNPGNIRYTVLIMLNTVFWFYIHTYLGMIILSFTFLSQVFVYIGDFKTKFRDQNIYIETFLQSVFPAIIVYVGISLFDNHPGRIEMPYQPQYRASFYSVIMPNHSWLRPLYELLFDLSPQKDQAWAQVGNYIGLSTIISIIIGLFVVFSNSIKHGIKSAINLFPKNFWPVLFASLILLLFANSFPFRFGYDYLLPSILKQFVSIGRFAWPFYYIVCFYGLYILWKTFSKNKVIGISIMTLSCLLLISEGYSNHSVISREIQKEKNSFNIEHSKPVPSYVYNWLRTQEYQSVLPLPFYHGYISLNRYKGSSASVELSELLSYHMGIPMFSASTARSSILESQEIAQIFLPPYYPKTIKNQLDNTPILICYTGEELTELEKKVLEKSRYLFQFGVYEFYSFRPQYFFRYNAVKELKQFFTHENLLVKDTYSGLYTIDSLMGSEVIYESFDEEKSEMIFRGESAIELNKNEHNTWFSCRAKDLVKNTEYELSFYYYNFLYDQSFTTVYLEIRDKEDNIIEDIYIDPVKSQYYNGDWAFNRITFTLNEKAHMIQLKSYGENLYSSKIYIDELLIRPSNVNVYWNIEGDVVIRNNENVPRF